MTDVEKQTPENGHTWHLPHGAVFSMRWDGEAGKWEGTLMVPRPEYGTKEFYAEAAELFLVEQTLDGMYHEWVQKGVK